jgi:hypothetical protein
MTSKRAIVIDYTNHRGERGLRRVVPDEGGLHYEMTEWHPERQWILYAFDLDKGARRGFALKDIHQSWPADELVPECLYYDSDASWHAIDEVEDEGSPYHYKRVKFLCGDKIFTPEDRLASDKTRRRPSCAACAREFEEDKPK